MPIYVTDPATGAKWWYEPTTEAPTPASVPVWDPPGGDYYSKPSQPEPERKLATLSWNVMAEPAPEPKSVVRPEFISELDRIREQIEEGKSRFYFWLGRDAQYWPL